MSNKSFLTPLLLALSMGLAAGCAHQRPAPETAPSSADFTTFDVNQGLVNVSKKLPKLLEMGQDLTYSIHLQAQDYARNVSVREEIPPNVRYIRSEPEATVLGNQLIWSFPEMAKGSSKTLSVTLKPVQEGRIEGYTTVMVEPLAYTATQVGKAKLTLSKSGPSNAIVGKDVTYEMKVTNTGTYVARGVSLTDQVPQGLVHPTNAREVVVQLGDLDPGQSRVVPVTLKAVQRGAVRNIGLAHSANAESAYAEAGTQFLLQTLKVAASGPDDQFVGKNAAYEIFVSNPGDVALKNVVVTDSMPAEGRILQATGASLVGNAATWTIGELAPGAERRYSVVATSQSPGVHKNLVQVKTAEGVTGQGEFSTLWRGMAGLLLQMGDSVDPIKEGDFTEFFITLTNQGTAADSNVRVQMSFPAGLQPLTASGATTATIAGQNVTFAPVASLGPKQSLAWKLTVKGVVAGDNRTRVQYTSDSIRVPVSKDESTQVY